MTANLAPNPDDFSRNDKPREYTAEIEVRGTFSISIMADSLEDARRQAETEMERIENEGYIEIENVEDMDLQRVTKDRPMHRVTREGKSMQVSHLQPGGLPRDPDPEYGF